MTYLITQTFILLLIAALLGLVLGWYLTRISANSARSAMQSRLNSAEADARELRGELDSAVAARGHAESERQQMAERVAELEETAGQAASTDTDTDELQRERDAAVAAHEAAETERQRLAARVAELETLEEEVAKIASLQGELDACREQLAASSAPLAAASTAAAPAGEPIAKVSAAAALAAAAMGGDAAQADDPADAAETARPAADDGNGEADDLQQIKGIGPKIAGILADLGIRRFDQIAAWSPDNVAWVNDQLRFKGRIEREEWIPQAKALIATRND